MTKQHSIYFYTTSSGRKVVEKFINNFDEITKARIRNSIKLLAEYGLTLLNTPWVKKIYNTPSLFELRITGKKQIRLIFFKYNPTVFVIVHIFVKKQQKTPLKEMRKAVKRVKEFL